jgi:E3 ubiquitin-protein ligase HUWE1
MRGPQRFSIHRAHGEHGVLPTAHTCFNQVGYLTCRTLELILPQLDLPVYRSLEEMKAKLLLAIKEGSEGFGFA